MRKEELEKYIYEEVEITFKVPGLREFTHKGMLVRENYIYPKAIQNVLGVKPSPNWFALIFENKKYYSFHFEEVKEIKRLEDKLTEVEEFILENTDERMRYIARDENGDLWLFENEPLKMIVKCSGEGYWSNGLYEKVIRLNYTMYNHIFQNIKWEDRKPYKFR